MDDLVQVGVFAGSDQLYMQTHHLQAGNQTIAVVVRRKPDSAGVDPNYLLLRVERSDNVKTLGSRATR